MGAACESIRQRKSPEADAADLGGFDNPSGTSANGLRGLVGGAKSVKTDWGGLQRTSKRTNGQKRMADAADLGGFGNPSGGVALNGL